jgi:RimJ/RimL family protein N-acetyltransferase
MDLRSIDNTDFGLVLYWLAQKENYQWLDFGCGMQSINSAALKLMIAKRSNVIRLFTADAGDVPIGMVGLADVSSTFKTAMIWYVLGDKTYSVQGYTTRSVRRLLNIGFTELGLEAVNAWTVETNIPSVRILERNGFKLIGRMRNCHEIDGQRLDRLLFDLLVSEHKDGTRTGSFFTLEECRFGR